MFRMMRAVPRMASMRAASLKCQTVMTVGPMGRIQPSVRSLGVATTTEQGPQVKAGPVAAYCNRTGAKRPEAKEEEEALCV